MSGEGVCDDRINQLQATLSKMELTDAIASGEFQTALRQQVLLQWMGAAFRQA